MIRKLANCSIDQLDWRSIALSKTLDAILRLMNLLVYKLWVRDSAVYKDGK